MVHKSSSQMFYIIQHVPLRQKGSRTCNSSRWGASALDLPSRNKPFKSVAMLVSFPHPSSQFYASRGQKLFTFKASCKCTQYKREEILSHFYTSCLHNQMAKTSFEGDIETRILAFAIPDNNYNHNVRRIHFYWDAKGDQNMNRTDRHATTLLFNFWSRKC